MASNAFIQPPPSPLDLPPSVPGVPSHRGVGLASTGESEGGGAGPLASAPRPPAPRRPSHGGAASSSLYSTSGLGSSGVLDFGRSKRKELDLLRGHEARRSAFFVEQFHTHQRYWQAFTALVRDQRACTERLLLWYTKRVAAYRAFASQLFAVNDSVQGQRRGITRTKARRSAERAYDAAAAGTPQLQSSLKHNSSAGGGPGGAAVSRTRSMGNITGVVGASSTRAAVPAAPSKAARMLDELCSMDCDVARAVDELCDYLESQVIGALSAMAQQTATQVEAILKEGDRAMGTLQGLDVYTAKAFETCHRTAAGILLAPGEGGPAASQAGAFGDAKPTQRRSSEVHDMWLADMHYRVAAHQQQVAWVEIAALMERLFARLREIELNRKAVIKELLAATLLRTNELWQQLPSAAADSITCLQSISLEGNELEKEICDCMAEQSRITSGDARRGSGDATAASGGVGSSGGGDNGPSGDAPAVDMRPCPAPMPGGAGGEALALPLPSPLVLHAAVLERKRDNVVDKKLKGSWAPCLVVLTADKFLHVFDLRADFDTSAATPETAFAAALPTIGAADTFRGKRDEKDAMVTPGLTLDVRNHHVAPRDACTKSHHLCQFGVTEIVHNAGLKGLFRGESFRRLWLRARSFPEMKEWVAKIAECGTNATAAAAAAAAAASANSGGSGGVGDVGDPLVEVPLESAPQTRAPAGGGGGGATGDSARSGDEEPWADASAHSGDGDDADVVVIVAKGGAGGVASGGEGGGGSSVTDKGTPASAADKSALAAATAALEGDDDDDKEGGGAAVQAE